MYDLISFFNPLFGAKDRDADVIRLGTIDLNAEVLAPLLIAVWRGDNVVELNATVKIGTWASQLAGAGII